MQEQTQSEPVIGPGQMAMRAFLAREISLNEAVSFVAHSIVESLSEYQVRPYSMPAAQLTDYVGARAKGLVEREPRLAIANGIWLDTVWRTYLENKHDVEFLEWAAAQCEAAKTEAGATKIREHVAGVYEMVEFPKFLYGEARIVQRLDVDERMSEGYMKKKA